MPKYRVVEEYVDCLCPSGENDCVVRSEVIEAPSADEAREDYERRYSVSENNRVGATPA